MSKKLENVILAEVSKIQNNVLSLESSTDDYEIIAKEDFLKVVKEGDLVLFNTKDKTISLAEHGTTENFNFDLQDEKGCAEHMRFQKRD